LDEADGKGEKHQGGKCAACDYNIGRRHAEGAGAGGGAGEGTHHSLSFHPASCSNSWLRCRKTRFTLGSLEPSQITCPTGSTSSATPPAPAVRVTTPCASPHRLVFISTITDARASVAVTAIPATRASPHSLRLLFPALPDAPPTLEPEPPSPQIASSTSASPVVADVDVASPPHSPDGGSSVMRSAFDAAIAANARRPPQRESQPSLLKPPPCTTAVPKGLKHNCKDA